MIQRKSLNKKTFWLSFSLFFFFVNMFFPIICEHPTHSWPHESIDLTSSIPAFMRCACVIRFGLEQPLFRIDDLKGQIYVGKCGQVNSHAKRSASRKFLFGSNPRSNLHRHKYEYKILNNRIVLALTLHQCTSYGLMCKNYISGSPCFLTLGKA